MTRVAAVSILAIACAARSAHAFCGFYVAGGDQPMFNDATQVVLMRKGTRTVLSMQNNYKGPPDAFAMVVPVPAVLHEGDVKTLPTDVFAHVEQMGAPRLVEYWEQDPCAPPAPTDRPVNPVMPLRARAVIQDKSLGVTVEAQFVVGEYQIVILSATDSTGLETWLRDQHYNIPAGAEPLLRPYVEGGSKFFVAKVDPTKVKFVDGRAALSPLRFFYDTDQFTLPIRLGLAASSGKQDLIVNILSPNQRYEVANYPNVTIPTNIDVRDSIKDKFGAFYAALFDRTLEQHPGAVVTEYAWAAGSCDPCPGPTLGPKDFNTLGADVLDPRPTEPAPVRRWGRGGDFVLTRLHARYGKDITDDLVFKEAAPIVGGRESVADAKGTLEQGARSSSFNNFQARYAIRHPWVGPISCNEPQRGHWGGPPSGGAIGIAPPKSAIGIAFAPRGEVQLASAVVHDVPELDLKLNAPAPAAAPESRGSAPKSMPGCGCEANDPGGIAIAALLVGGLSRPRRRRRRHNSEVSR